MTFDQLRYFFAAARFEYIAEESPSVAISPSAVSNAIGALEDELGCALFDREGERIVLNDAGKYPRDEAERVLHHLARVQ
jgi:DNA-binding transcriptional LysR family regulator